MALALTFVTGSGRFGGLAHSLPCKHAGGIFRGPRSPDHACTDQRRPHGIRQGLPQRQSRCPRLRPVTQLHLETRFRLAPRLRLQPAAARGRGSSRSPASESRSRRAPARVSQRGRSCSLRCHACAARLCARATRRADLRSLRAHPLVGSAAPALIRCRLQSAGTCAARSI